MEKQTFTDGKPITPEWLNAIQNPSFEGSSEDVGHLPLPPEYGRKIEVFQSVNGSVDLSSATSLVAMIYHEGSPSSLQKETLSVNLPSGSAVKVFFLIPVGADYELDVVLPIHGTSTTTVNLKAGSIGIFKRFSYGGNLIWKYTELNRRDLTAYFKSIETEGKIKSGPQTTEPSFPANVGELPEFNGGFFGKGVDGNASNWIHISECGILINKIVQSNTAARFVLHVEDKGWVVRGLKTIESGSGNIGSLFGSALAYDKVTSKILIRNLVIPQNLTTNDLKDNLGDYFAAYGSSNREIFRIPTSYEHGGAGRIGMSMTFSMSGYEAETGEIVTVHNIGSDELRIDFNSTSVTIEPGFCKQFIALNSNLWSCVD